MPSLCGLLQRAYPSPFHPRSLCKMARVLSHGKARPGQLDVHTGATDIVATVSRILECLWLESPNDEPFVMAYEEAAHGIGCHPRYKEHACVRLDCVLRGIHPNPGT